MCSPNIMGIFVAKIDMVIPNMIHYKKAVVRCDISRMLDTFMEGEASIMKAL